MKAILIGVDGFGKMWRQGIAESSEVEVVGLVDVNSDFLKEASAYFSVPQENCFTNPYLTWHDRLKADFIIDSTPHPFHFKNAVQAFRAGMDAIVVKPMSDVAEDAHAMVVEAGIRGRKLVVAQQLRYFAPCMKMREMIASGAIGEIAWARIDAHFARTGPVREKWYQPYPMLIEAAIHHFDLVRWIMGLEAVSVMADTWNMPWNDPLSGKKSALAVFEMANGARVSFQGIPTAQETCNYPGHWRVEGDKGVLELKTGAIWLDDQRIWPERAEETFALDLSALNAIVLKEATAYFKDGTATPLDGENNLKSIDMALGAVRSAEEGRRIKL